jgi:hypothetical protein
MQSIIKNVLLILFLGFSSFSLAQNNVTNNLLETVPEAMNNQRYNVKTVIEKNGSGGINIEMSDVYIYTSNHSYHRNEYRNDFGQTEYIEYLVDYNDMSNDYYKRVSKHNSHNMNNVEDVPYIQFDDTKIEDTVLDFSNHVLFDIERFRSGDEWFFPIAISDLTVKQLDYINKYLSSKEKGLILPEEGNIICELETSADAITKITLMYWDVFEGYTSFNQTVTISNDTNMVVEKDISDAVDSENLDFIAEGESFNFLYEHSSGQGQYGFIEVVEADEFLFVTSSDDNVSPQWDLYDLDFNSHLNKIKTSDSNFLNNGHTSVYLEPGIYLLYLQEMSLGIDFASISFDKKSTDDDFYNTKNPNTLEVINPGTYDFSIDYEHDVDAFKIVGDFDYLMIEKEGNFSTGVDYFSNIDLNEMASTNIIEMPDSGVLTLFLTSHNTGDYQISFTFYSLDGEPVPFEDSLLIDIYETSEDSLYINMKAFPFSGGIHRYQFEVKDDSLVYITSGSTNVDVYDVNLKIVEASDQRIYDLPKGLYYLELNNFSSDYSIVNIYPERKGEEIIVLNEETTEHHIVGFISDINDVDLYQFTLSEESMIYFDSFVNIPLLIFGVDNPEVVIKRTNTKTDLYLPAGTYKITLPRSISYGYEYGYKITMTTQAYTEGDAQ